MQDYSGFQLLSRPQTPHIAVPTTAGTGSEATYAAVVKDWENNEKILFCDNHIIPRVAILDPLLTAGLPPPLTASTGIDALTHAIEALHAPVSYTHLDVYKRQMSPRSPTRSAGETFWCSASAIC